MRRRWHTRLGAGHLLAACATAVPLLTYAGARTRDGRVILLGTAFSTMTALLAVHGLATPTVLVGPNGVIALAGGLSLPVGAGILALTALPRLRRPPRIGRLLAFQGVLAVAVPALGAIGLLLPALTRILAVCDVYDALVSDRVYRGAWTPERALALLRDDAYDRRVVRALESVLGTPAWVASVAEPAAVPARTPRRCDAPSPSSSPPPR